MQKILFLVLISIIFAQEYPKGKDIPQITKAKWVSDLITLARDRKSKYKNSWPYNVLYYDGTYWWADCVNVNKALFNGRNINDFTVGGYQGYLGNTGDITTEQMIDRCTSVSHNFSQLKQGEPRILHLYGHIGAYLGKVVDVGGAKYNVVEATGSFGYKMAFSWVDDNGVRRSERGGYTNGRWEMHGKPSKWVKY